MYWSSIQEWWADSYQQSSWRSTTQCNMRSMFITINRSVIMCNEWPVLTGVADSRSLCSEKLQFSQNVLCGMSLQRCLDWQPGHDSTAFNQVQQSLWGCRTSHPFDFNGGMTRKIISTFRLRLAQPAIATWARKRSLPEAEELDAILQPGS